MRITDEEYNRLIQENKELKEDHARLLDTIRLIGDERDSLKAQRDQLYAALDSIMAINVHSALTVAEVDAIHDAARTALEATRSD